RPLCRRGLALGQGERGAPIGHAREPALAETQIVDQAEAAFAHEAGAAGEASERWRRAGFPGPRPDGRLAIPFRPQPMGERAMLAQGETLARQVDDDALAHTRHIVEQRRDHRGRQDVDRGAWKSLLQQLNDGVAANEVADPHVGHDQNWRFGHQLAAPSAPNEAKFTISYRAEYKFIS